MSRGESEYIFLILTHMEDDGSTFWAQQRSPTIKSDLEQVMSRLEKLSASNTLQVNDPIKGRVYGCQYVDNCWYRCRVLFSISKNKYLIQFIDYGNCEERDQNSLIDIPINLQESSLPAMAHRFCLHDVHVEHDNVEKAQKFLRKMCSEKFVKAKLMSNCAVAPTEVLLFDEDGSDICIHLRKTGLAITAAAAAEIKQNVKVSPPVVSMAQRFRNPLLSSSDESSDDCNNNRFKKLLPNKKLASSQSSGLDSMNENDGGTGPEGDGHAKRKLSWKAHCDSCQDNKDEVQRMRLAMMKMRHDLADSDRKIADLIGREGHWKNQYVTLREEQIRSGPVEKIPQNPTIETSMGSTKQSVVKIESKIHVPVEDQAEVVVEKNKTKSPVMDQIWNRIRKSGSEAPKKELAVDKSEEAGIAKANAAMKKVLLPTFEFLKKLSTSIKTISDCQTYEQELKEVVEKIKTMVDTVSVSGKNSDNFLSLVAQRNTVLQDLKQTIRSTLPYISVCEDELLKEKVENFMAPLKRLAVELKIEEDTLLVEVSDVGEKIRNWKTDKENSADISAIVKALFACLSQASSKLFGSGAFLSRVKPMQDEISTFQSQEKIIKDTVDEIKSIRKRKQKIRLLVAGLKNLEEEEKDACATEKEVIREEVQKTSKELSSIRNDLQESFEAKWILLESLADMTEKFSPELQIEHPELKIKEYIKGKGIVMSDMELDHFDIERTEWNNALKIECIYTYYRGEPIVLHKYILHSVSESTWDAALQEIAIYTNVESSGVIAPMGVFNEKDATYIMATVPPVTTVALAKKRPLDHEIAKNVLKSVAEALSSLHENGICHGQMSHSFISVSEDLPNRIYLSVPNIETRCQQISQKDASTTSLATDVYQFGLLAKTLGEKTGDDEVLGNLAKQCIEDSTSITMKQLLEQF